MLTGEFTVSVDEKGRIMIPSRLKNELDTNSVVITKASDSRNCLQVYKIDKFKDIASALDSKFSPYDKNAQILRMRFIAPAQEVQFDKAGRINIPQSLRSFAKLDLKSEIIVLGMMDSLEFWNKEEYEKFCKLFDDPSVIEEAANSLYETIK